MKPKSSHHHSVSVLYFISRKQNQKRIKEGKSMKDQFQILNIKHRRWLHQNSRN
jgi:hypothetical protein